MFVLTYFFTTVEILCDLPVVLSERNMIRILMDKNVQLKTISSLDFIYIPTYNYFISFSIFSPINLNFINIQNLQIFNENSKVTFPKTFSYFVILHLKHFQICKT